MPSQASPASTNPRDHDGDERCTEEPDERDIGAQLGHEPRLLHREGPLERAGTGCGRRRQVTGVDQTVPDQKETEQDAHRVASSRHAPAEHIGRLGRSAMPMLDGVRLRR
jgi:hypothetical protein